jgi:quercetin dioxygenase-like cupin family protein
MSQASVSSVDLPRLAAGLDDVSVTGSRVDVAGQQILLKEVFTTGQTQAVLYSLRKAQTIPPHRHTGIDDIFLGVRGTGHVRTWDEQGGQAEHAIAAGSIYAVTPGTVHELVSDSDDFAYVLMQSPKEEYDLIPVETPQ